MAKLLNYNNLFCRSRFTPEVCFVPKADVCGAANTKSNNQSITLSAVASNWVGTVRPRGDRSDERQA